MSEIKHDFTLQATNCQHCSAPFSTNTELCEDYLRQEREKWLGELWGSAEYDCGPHDYEFMVEESIKAMRMVKR